MREYYYYFRDPEENKPRITVCLMESEGVLCRGIAICSLDDNPVKEVGRELAMYKCLRAFKKGEDGCYIKRGKALDVLEEVKAKWMEKTPKSYFDTEPWDDFEKKLLTEEEGK